MHSGPLRVSKSLLPKHHYDAGLAKPVVIKGEYFLTEDSESFHP